MDESTVKNEKNKANQPIDKVWKQEDVKHL